MVQSRQPFTYRLRESVGLGGPRWHGSSWQRGIAESGSSRLSTLMIEIVIRCVEIRCEICHPCSKQATWKGAYWCGYCPCTCMLIKNLILMMIIIIIFKDGVWGGDEPTTRGLWPCGEDDRSDESHRSRHRGARWMFCDLHVRDGLWWQWHWYS